MVLYMREIPRGDFKHWKERGVRRITVQLAVWYGYDVSGMTARAGRPHCTRLAASGRTRHRGTRVAAE
ncbi:MAG: hypothetical protein MHM6MM_003517 [Cercozoa sp. M6MM]